MEVMVTRLSRSHLRKAFSTCSSAMDSSVGSVFVRMRSQVARRACSRSIMFLPLVTFSRKSAMALERSFQNCVSGVMSNLSAAKSATTAMAAIVRSCWRFLIFNASSFVPAEIKCKLQRRFIASGGWPVQIANLAAGPQIVPNLEQRLAVLRCPGADDIVEIANFNALGGNRAFVRKCLGNFLENGQRPQRIIEPWAALMNLLSHTIQLFHFGRHRQPLGAQARELPLLESESTRDDEEQRRGGCGGPAQVAPGIASGHLLPGRHARRQQFEGRFASSQLSRSEAQRRRNRRIRRQLQAELIGGIAGHQLDLEAHRFEA